MTPDIGDALQVFRFGPIDPRSMATWAGLLKDPNPIHLDVEAVKGMGLGDRRINQGPANLAYLINPVLQTFPGARFERIVNRFIGNVFEGDMIVATGTVTRVDPSTDGTRVTCDMVLEAVGRGAVVTGTIVVCLSC